MEQSNVHLIYEYTKESYEQARQNTARLNIRLSSVLITSGLLLGSIVDVESLEPLSRYSLLLSAIFSVGSIASCAVGLSVSRTKSQVGTGSVVAPQELMKDWYRGKTDEECRCFIVNTWVKAIDDIDALTVKKSDKLKTALWLLALAGVCLSAQA